MIWMWPEVQLAVIITEDLPLRFIASSNIRYAFLLLNLVVIIPFERIVR